jgi:hypothetical protein
LNETYDLDTLEALVLGPPVCAACGEPAAKKCSRCKAPYCGRYNPVIIIRNTNSHKTFKERLMMTTSLYTLPFE